MRSSEKQKQGQEKWSSAAVEEPFGPLIFPPKFLARKKASPHCQIQHKRKTKDCQKQWAILLLLLLGHDMNDFVALFLVNCL